MVNRDANHISRNSCQPIYREFEALDVHQKFEPRVHEEEIAATKMSETIAEDFMGGPIEVETVKPYRSRALRGWEPVVTSRNGAPDPVGGGPLR